MKRKYGIAVVFLGAAALLPFVPSDDARATVAPELVAIHASTCTVQDGGAAYVRDFNGITFASGATGFLDIYCPIPTMEDDYDLLSLMYTDSTGTSSSYVAASVVEVGNLSGYGTIVSVDSNDYSDSTATLRSKGYVGAWDHTNNTYFLYVNMWRSSSAHTLRFRGARLH